MAENLLYKKTLYIFIEDSETVFIELTLKIKKKKLKQKNNFTIFVMILIVGTYYHSQIHNEVTVLKIYTAC